MKKIKVPVLNILNTMIPYFLSFSPCFSRCQITKKYQMIITWWGSSRRSLLTGCLVSQLASMLWLPPAALPRLFSLDSSLTTNNKQGYHNLILLKIMFLILTSDFVYVKPQRKK